MHRAGVFEVHCRDINQGDDEYRDEKIPPREQIQKPASPGENINRRYDSGRRRAARSCRRRCLRRKKASSTTIASREADRQAQKAAHPGGVSRKRRQKNSGCCARTCGSMKKRTPMSFAYADWPAAVEGALHASREGPLNVAAGHLRQHFTFIPLQVEAQMHRQRFARRRARTRKSRIATAIPKNRSSASPATLR